LNFYKKKVLITGSEGFIGKSIKSLLASNENDYELFTPNKKELHLFDFTQVKGYLNTAKPDVVIHCAAVLPSKAGEQSSKEGTIRIDSNIVNAVIDYNKNLKLIYCSGCSLYKNNGQLLDESNELFSLNPYLEAKIAGEKLISESLLNSVILRIAAPYGFQQKIQTVIHIFVKRAITDNNIEIFEEGLRVQNFTNVKDVSKAIAEAIKTDKVGTYNICSDRSITMKELAEKIISLSNSKSKIVYKPNIKDKDDTKVLNLDNSKAKHVLKWKPTVTIEEGIIELINEYRNNL